MIEPGEDEIRDEDGDVGLNGGEKLGIGGEAPHAAIEMEEAVNNDDKNTVDDNGFVMKAPVMPRNGGEDKVKPEEKSKGIRSQHCEIIICGESNTDDSPVLEEARLCIFS